MKKLFFLAVTLFAFSGAFAQKGSILYYGDLGGSSYKYDNISSGTIKSNSFYLNSGLGYQFSNHITAGLQGSYGRGAYTTRDNIGGVFVTTKNISTSYSVGLFGRYTYYINDMFFVFLQADAGYNQLNGKAPFESSNNSIGANLTPAVGMFIYKNWALNLNFGGINYLSTGSLDYSIGRQLKIGVSKNFIRHKKSDK